ncbi:MAG: hypothetical protein RID25_07390, partial [Cyclobacteriaceae bacterium]
MKRFVHGILFSFFLTFIWGSCSQKESSIAEFQTNHFKIEISDVGSVLSLTDLATGSNYLSEDSSSYLMSIRVDG